ncbi:MAG: endopeptidase La, partial [Candidatus Gastranaerophilales bacterium]|nr:endopeptidase La [Candidatus Gastranaerophilales bacterium]
MNEIKESTYTPILTMKDIVLFPQMMAPIFVGRKHSTVAVENAMLTKDHEIILLGQKQPDIENPTENDLYKVGVLAKIPQVLRFPDMSMKLIAEGISRVKVIKLIKDEGYFKCEYEELKDKKVEGKDVQALRNLTLQKFTEYIKKSTRLGIENLLSFDEITEAGRLADIICAYLNIKSEERQKILEILNTFERLKAVSKILSREIEFLFIEENLQEKVSYKLGKSQKEYVLREKLRAIKEELGVESGTDEVDELRDDVEKMAAPDYVKTKLQKELNKLEGMGIYSSETSVVRTYIDTIMELPWEKRTKDILDIARARKILDKDHYGLEDVKERILEFLAVKKLSKEPLSSIICLVGPPGVGKTSLARSIARSMNKNFAQVSLGGINDESEIRGHRRTYVGAMPGKIIKAMQDANSKNPLILLDEIEKMIPSHMGDPTAAMLEVLDPAQNFHFTDHYVDMPFDLSDVFFLTTANSIDKLYKPLKDRIEVIRLAGYTEEEKLHIAQKFLLPKQLKAHGIKKLQFNITKMTIKQIINDYTREAGVRELERTIAKLCRKFAVKLVDNQELKETITKENIADYLGVARYLREKTEKKALVGVVHGLAWTEVGGEILEIEACKMPGKGKLNLTGRLGEIMQESAQTAFSYARSRYKELNLPEDIQEKYDLHIHAGDGATPKDGPSAGIALTLCLISTLTG